MWLSWSEWGDDSKRWVGWVSGTEGLRFSSTCKLTNLAYTVLWILAEGIRLLSQRPKPLLFVAQQEAWQQHISISSPSSESQGGNVQPPGGCDVPESLIMVCKQTCQPFAWRELWSLSHWIASKLLSALEGDAVFFQSCLLATDFWKDCLEQSVSSWKMCRKARDPWRIVSHW